jgi:hypothetical protein
MRPEVIHVTEMALNRGQCNAHAQHSHVRRDPVPGKPGRWAQILCPWQESLELLQLLLVFS